MLAATLEDAWQVAYEIAVRAGGDPGYPGLFGPASAPAPRKPRRLAFLETAGWDAASTGAKAAMADALARIKSAGIELATSQSHAKVAAAAAAIKGARALSMRINGNGAGRSTPIASGTRKSSVRHCLIGLPRLNV